MFTFIVLQYELKCVLRTVTMHKSSCCQLFLSLLLLLLLLFSVAGSVAEGQESCRRYPAHSLSSPYPIPIHLLLQAQDSMDMHEPDHDDSSVDSVFLKMLVSDAIAGAVIGKSGGNISGLA